MLQVHKKHLLPLLVESLGEPTAMTEEQELRFDLFYSPQITEG